MGLDSRADFKPDGIVIGDYEIASLSGCQPSDCGYICVSNIEDIVSWFSVKWKIGAVSLATRSSRIG